MNERILKLINTIYNIVECKGQQFSLTLNYNKEITKKGKYKIHKDKGGFMEHIGWDIPILNEDGMKQIATSMSEVDDITSFNFTLIFEHGIYRDTDFNYDEDWYDCKIIFYGDKNNIYMSFDILSTYSHLERGIFHRALCPIKGEDEEREDKETENSPILDESKIEETVQKLLELKNLLVNNGSKLIQKFKEISLIIKK